MKNIFWINKSFCFTAIMVLILSGCGGGSNAIISMESSSSILKLDRSTTLAGTDINNNGVRDDIETHINSTYTIITQRKAAMRAAKAMQEALLVDTTNIVSVKAVDKKISLSIHCVYSVFDGIHSKQPAQISQEIESMTTNTKQRLLAYLVFNKALDGTASSLPNGDTCD